MATSNNIIVFITSALIFVSLLLFSTFFSKNDQVQESKGVSGQDSKVFLMNTISSNINTNPTNSGDADFETDIPSLECNDPVWCNIPMPTQSFYKFDPPSDPIRWKKAQILAASGEQVLLREVIKVFPNHFDFLDGDIAFRKLHFLMDMFIDERRDLSPLTVKSIVGGGSDRRKLLADRQQNGSSHVSQMRRKLAGKKPALYSWEEEKKSVIPSPYDFITAKRAPIVSVGYTAFQRDSQTYFTGNRLGGAFLDRKQFLAQWRKVKDRIVTPFIAVCALNENWGFLSTYFPNRTAGWGQCCSRTPQDTLLYDFLNHDKTLLLVTNQHTNVSHPKVMILPRGIPITWGFTRMLIWDTQRQIVRQNVTKNILLFSSASKWGPRPQILACISKKFSVEDFSAHVALTASVAASTATASNRFSREEYYRRLSTARFGLGLPGLGYDCFRNWELLTMGSIVVLEKGVGLDRTMWRLPALLVDDFADLTPSLLRTAYVEALYRAKDFEYQRLTMSFWYNVILNVSASNSLQPMLDAFPMRAEDETFTRPREVYQCGKSNSCGGSTKRIPRESC